MPKAAWGVAGLIVLAILIPFAFSSSYILGICSLICMYAAINLMWALIIVCGATLLRHDGGRRSSRIRRCTGVAGASPQGGR